MNQQRKVFFITGSIGKGKTSFLNNISLLLRRQWRADGFTCLPRRRNTPEQNAESYEIKLLRDSALYPWATRKDSGEGYYFDHQTLEAINRYFDDQKLQRAEVMILDDLGFLEVGGEGFAPLFARALVSNDRAMVVGIKKQAIEGFVEKFAIENYEVFDLDQQKGRSCKKKLLRELSKLDAEDIGIFSSINGMIEVSLGSFLHASRFPFKGYILVAMQNFFLILFSKELKGRGLYSISLISAAMKSFSPAGGRLKPMIYIFLQGLCFALPISLLGHNFFSCLIGSMAIQLISLVFKFLSAYLTFGAVVFDSSLNLMNQLLAMIHLPQVSLISLLLFLAAMKVVLGGAISLIAYYFDFSFLLLRWRGKIDTLTPKGELKIIHYSWKDSIKLAFRDMTLKRFLFPMLLTLALIYFFANLSSEGFIGVALRALIISWMALVLSRRIDFNKIIDRLNRHGFEHLAHAMKKAISLVQSFRERL